MSAVAGTHAPGRGEGVVGSRRWSGDIINAVSSCRGCKGQRLCQVVETLTPHMLSEGEEGWTAVFLLIKKLKNVSCEYDRLNG